MITPIEIQNKEFTRGVRGYKEEEVDSFLDLITLDLERLILDNRRMKDNIDMLTQEAERHRNSESAVLETLEAAKALMGDISASAEKRAEILLKNAEMDAERIQREARESVERLTEEAAGLRSRINILKARYRNLLETELERFDSLSAELFPEDVRPGSLLGGKEPAEGGGAASGVSFPEASRADSRTITNLRVGDAF
ncbi:MAG: DivIVA domain-containing protein [Clostridiales Family XIII bacterium]|jgi:cell division initiation protein|nr:DivIVA domain-containing protein [Clostridiales Family XIII bacterium]